MGAYAQMFSRYIDDRAMSQFNLGSLVYSVGLDYSVAQQELNRFEQILESSSQRFSIMITENISNAFSDAVQASMDRSRTEGFGRALATGLLSGFTGVLAAGMTEALNVAVSTAIQSRASLVKSTVGGIGNSIVQGMQLYGDEKRAMERAKYNFGAGDRSAIPAQFSKEAENQIVELASETARTRGEVTNLLYELSRSGFSASRVVNERDSLLRSTVQLSEAADLTDMKDAAFLLSSLKTVFTNTDTKEIASGLYGLTTTNLARFEQYRYAFQDAAPSAAAAGVDFSKDFLPSMSLLFKQMSPEVAGTAFKTLMQSIVSPTGGSGGFISQISQQIQTGEYEGLDSSKGFIGNLTTSGNFLKTIRNLEDIVTDMFEAGRIGDFRKGESWDTISSSRKNQEIQKVISMALGGSDTAIQTYRSLTAPADKDVEEIERRFASFTDPDRKESAIELAQKIKYEGFAGALDQISSSMENVSVSMGKLVSPGVTQAILTFRDVANDLNEDIPAISAPLERISDMIANTLKPGTAQYENIVEGVKNVFNSTFRIFEGWTSRILDLFNTEAETERTFASLQRLIIDTTSAFGTLASVMENLLPLVNDLTGGRLGKAEAKQAANRQKIQQAANSREPDYYQNPLPDWMENVPGLSGVKSITGGAAGAVNIVLDWQNPDQAYYGSQSGKDLSNRIWFDDSNNAQFWKTDTVRALSTKGEALTSQELDEISKANINFGADAGTGIEDGKIATAGNRFDPRRQRDNLRDALRRYSEAFRVAGETYVTVDRKVGDQVRTYLYQLDEKTKKLNAVQNDQVLQKLKTLETNTQGTKAYQTFGAGALGGRGLSQTFLTAKDPTTKRALETLQDLTIGGKDVSEYLVTKETEEGDTQFRLTKNRRKLDSLTNKFFEQDKQGNLQDEREILDVLEREVDGKTRDALRQAIDRTSYNIGGGGRRGAKAKPVSGAAYKKMMIQDLVNNQGFSQDEAQQMLGQLLPSLGTRAIQEKAAIANYSQFFTPGKGGYDTQKTNQINTAVQEGDLTEALQSGEFKINDSFLNNPSKMIDQLSGDGELTQAQIKAYSEAFQNLDIDKLGIKDQGELAALEVMKAIFAGLENVEVDDKSALKELLQRVIDEANEDAQSGVQVKGNKYQAAIEGGANLAQSQYVKQQTGILQGAIADFENSSIDDLSEALEERFDNFLEDGDKLSQEAFDNVSKQLAQKAEDLRDKKLSTEDPEERKKYLKELDELRQQSLELEKYAQSREEITYKTPAQIGDPGITLNQINRQEIAEQQKVLSQRRSLFDTTQKLARAERDLLAQRESLFGQANQMLSSYFSEIGNIENQRAQTLMGISGNALAQKRLDAEREYNIAEGMNQDQLDILGPYLEQQKTLLTETINNQMKMLEILPELKAERLKNFFERGLTNLFTSIRDSGNLVGTFNSASGSSFKQLLDTYRQAIPRIAKFQQQIETLEALSEDEPQAYEAIKEGNATLEQLRDQLGDLKKGVIENLKLLADKINIQTLIDFQQSQSKVLSDFQSILSGSPYQTQAAIATFQNQNALQLNQLRSEQNSYDQELNITGYQRGGTEANAEDTMDEARRKRLENLRIQKASSMVSGVTSQVVQFYQFLRNNIQTIADQAINLSKSLQGDYAAELYKINRGYEQRSRQIESLKKNGLATLNQLQEMVAEYDPLSATGTGGRSVDMAKQVENSLSQALGKGEAQALVSKISGGETESLAELLQNDREQGNRAIKESLSLLENQVSNLVSKTDQISQAKQTAELIQLNNRINERLREPLRTRQEGMQELMGLEADRLQQYQLNPYADREAQRIQFEAERRQIEAAYQREQAEIESQRKETQAEKEANPDFATVYEQQLKALDIREEKNEKARSGKLEVLEERQSQALERFTQEFLRVGETIIDGLKSATDQLVDGMASGSENLGETIRETLAEIPRTYLKGTLRDIVDNVFGPMFQPFDKKDISLQEATLGQFTAEFSQTLSGKLEDTYSNLNDLLKVMLEQQQGLSAKLGEEFNRTQFADALGFNSVQGMNSLFEPLFSDGGKLFQELAQIPNLDVGSSAMIAMQQETNQLLTEIKDILSANQGGGGTSSSGGLSGGSYTKLLMGDKFNPKADPNNLNPRDRYIEKFGLNKDPQTIQAAKSKLSRKYDIEIPEMATKEEQMKLVVAMLKNRGHSEEEIAAYITYMNEESQGNPYAYNPKENAYSLFQYQGGREQGLPKATGNRTLDLAQAVDFSLKEGGLGDKLKGSGNPIQTMAGHIRPAAEHVKSRENQYQRLLQESRNLMEGSGVLSHPTGGEGDFKSPYGMRKHPISGKNRMHKGVDISLRKGSKVEATHSGKVSVLTAQRDKQGNVVGWGNYIIIEGESYRSLYAHLSGYADGIRVGSSVRQGQTIGYVGSTGSSTGPHLHYELWVKDENGNWVQKDPQKIHNNPNAGHEKLAYSGTVDLPKVPEDRGLNFGMASREMSSASVATAGSLSGLGIGREATASPKPPKLPDLEKLFPSAGQSPNRQSTFKPNADLGFDSRLIFSDGEDAGDGQGKFVKFLRRLFGLEADYASMDRAEGFKSMISGLMNLGGAFQMFQGRAGGGFTGADSYGFADGYNFSPETDFGTPVNPSEYEFSGETGGSQLGWRDYAQLGTSLFSIGSGLFGGNDGLSDEGLSKEKYGDDPFNKDGGNSKYMWRYDPRSMTGLRAHIKEDKEEKKGGGFLSTLLGIGSMVGGLFGGMAEGGALTAVYPGEEWYSQDYLDRLAERNGFDPGQGLQIAESLRLKTQGKGKGSQKSLSEILAGNPNLKVQDFQGKQKGRIQGATPRKADLELANLPNGFVANTDLLNSPEWRNFQMGNLPAMAEGGLVKPTSFGMSSKEVQSFEGRSVSYTNNSQGPSPEDNEDAEIETPRVDVAYEAKEIAGERYVSEDQFRRGIEEGVNRAVSQVTEKLRYSRGFRKKTGLN